MATEYKIGQIVRILPKAVEEGGVCAVSTGKLAKICQLYSNGGVSAQMLDGSYRWSLRPSHFELVPCNRRLT